MLRSVALFLHVISAMGIVAAIMMEGAALGQLRRATDPPQLRSALQAYRPISWIGGVSMVILLVSGIFLATVYWGWRGPWIGLGFLGFLVVAGIGGFTNGRRLPKLTRSLDAADASAEKLRAAARDPVLWRSFFVRLALLIGIVFVMTVKPGVGLSLAAMLVVAAAGFVARLPARG